MNYQQGSHRWQVFNFQKSLAQFASLPFAFLIIDLTYEPLLSVLQPAPLGVHSFKNVLSLESVIHHGILYNAMNIYKAVLSCCTSWGAQVINLTSNKEQYLLLWVLLMYYPLRHMYRCGWETSSAGEFLERMLMLESGSSVLGLIWKHKIKYNCNLVLLKLA